VGVFQEDVSWVDVSWLDVVDVSWLDVSWVDISYLRCVDEIVVPIDAYGFHALCLFHSLFSISTRFYLIFDSSDVALSKVIVGVLFPCIVGFC